MRARVIKLHILRVALVVVGGCADLAGPASGAPDPVVPESPATAELAQSGPLLYDDFEDGVLSSDLWTEMEGDPSITVHEGNGRLEFAFVPTTSGAAPTHGVISRCVLVGDFDVQVRYQTLDWPDQNGVRLALGAGSDMAVRHSGGSAESGRGERYYTIIDGVTSFMYLTTDYAGRMRLTRSGSTITGYYGFGTGWRVLSSRTVAGEVAEVPLTLTAWTHESAFAGQEVVFAFDDLVVNAGVLSCPETVTQVAIDIKPDSEENTLNTRSRGPVKVAVLTTSIAAGEISDFDALTVDAASAVFGPGEAPALDAGSAEDVDGDGDLDLVLRFDLQAAGLADGQSEACVAGTAGESARRFSGCDVIRLIEPGGAGRGNSPR
jgi:hypothetical protein